ncbi:MAG: zf-HC2 domain-containing protein [Gammaproteobacteria bacterium]|nr:zf-HC2 domain-containing protein [Gammaproteobacteria bacterium]
MNCQATNNLMQDFVDGRLAGDDTEQVSAHLEQCGACRENYQDILGVIELLQQRRVPPASPGFTTAVLERAIDAAQPPRGRRMPYMAGGIAASFIAAFVLLSMMTNPAHPTAQVVLIGNQVQTIKVAIESAHPVDSIRMTIDVSDNLEISGYQDQKVISWNTRLEKGTNIIALPVSAIARGDGEINARVGLNDREKVFKIKTRYRPLEKVRRDIRLLAWAGSGPERRDTL